MISPTTSTLPTNRTEVSGPPNSSALTSDFETFLQMLTTQAQNQDPLEPMDSSQYASQLAQFSMVEQQVQTNTLLSTLASALGNVDLGELAGWVGMDVKTPSAFRFDGAPVSLSATANPAADTATLIIRNQTGEVVDRATVSTNESEFLWAGTRGDGSPMLAGLYSATLESYRNDELLSENPVSAYGRVIEAQAGGDSVLLTLEGGEVVSANQVTAVRTGS